MAVGVPELNEFGPAMRMFPAFPVPVVEVSSKPPVIVKSLPSMRISPAVPMPDVVLEMVVLVLVTESGVLINKKPVLGGTTGGREQVEQPGSLATGVWGR